MRVRNYPITIMNKPAFKSKEYTDDGVLGYSDALSQKTREGIREWHDSYYMPYRSLYEKECNLSEYQMKQLLGTLMGKPKKVDYNKVTGINAYNVKTLNDEDTCYRGSTLMNKPEALRTIKDAGIERVIDLVGYYGYEKEDILRTDLVENYLANSDDFTSTETGWIFDGIPEKRSKAKEAGYVGQIF